MLIEFPGFPGGSVVKNQTAMQQIQVQCLGWKDTLEEGMATHSSILLWRMPWTESLVGYSPYGQRVRHNWSKLALLHASVHLYFSGEPRLTHHPTLPIDFYFCWELTSCWCMPSLSRKRPRTSVDINDLVIWQSKESKLVFGFSLSTIDNST